MIPIAEPQIGLEEQEKVIEVLNSKMLAQGKYVQQFEAEFAGYLNIKYAIATSSGTTALHAIMEALPITPGDKVLTTPFSFIASANAILYCGAIPVFVDIDPCTYNLSPKALAQAIKKHPDAKAVLVVHIFGLPAEMESICQLVKENNLLLIEDCAQAHGAAYKGKKVGTFGDAAAYSFYPTKNITCGEGGMVVTNSGEIADRVRMIINHGQSHRYRHHILGYNFRLTNIHAAIGIAQLKKLESLNRKRIHNAHYYRQHINNHRVVLPCEPKDCLHVYHQFTLQVKNRERFITYLQQKGVGCAVHYPLIIPHQRLYRDNFNYSQSWPVAEKICRRCVSIPVHPGLTGEQRQYIAEVVNNYA
ncbi:dTDP-4-amino-4,6-dideoxygalactose transaminase [Desulfohalotomaculum tongense]|uniref:DegT/DnrJ/EryC1/StrS family aminotransferase n=1 Tax=Desulforadius tongensis TaxID=1216062 RepID=UPI00195E7F61|nr:DegT/DnrJ/EryC1/StrS family aminotransferase [Desulforadius tongensis]MBM7855533.1 dTDP-4-amino-4,6-dideoxygalactose transaminase [Desulforadius tongensis]